jgi:S-DNA-T family DNA segregation ATPase FtsK/SpoIIIE
LATADRTLDDEAELPRPKARARKKAEESTPARSEPARSEPARGERPRAVPAEEEGRRHEVLGLFALAGTILTGLALFSYDAREVGNAIGFVGQSIASVLATAFGVAAWFVPLELALLTGRLFRRSRSPLGLARLASTVVVVLIGCAMVHLAMPEQEVMGGHLPGGLLGEVLGELMRSLFGLVGAFVVGFTMLLVTMVLRTSLSVVGMGKQVAGVAKLGGEKAKEGIGQVATALREAREIELREREEERLRNQPKIVVGASSAGAVPAPIPPAAKTDKLDKSDVADKARGKKKPAPVAEVETEDAEAAEVERDGLTDTDPDGALEAHDDEDEASADDEVDDAIDDADERVVVATVGKEVSGRRDPPRSRGHHVREAARARERHQGQQDRAALARRPRDGLAAQKVRIVAPIPGKARVGFELPNKHRQMVSLREILETRAGREQGGAARGVRQGHRGQPVYGDLAKMPHLLVAGATGAGQERGPQRDARLAPHTSARPTTCAC